MTDQRDRFDPQTGCPIEYPSEPAQPIDPASTAATHHIAPPGQVHPDQGGRRTVEEPRDVILNDPAIKPIHDRMSLAERIAAKARARDDATIEVLLPDLGERVQVKPRTFAQVLADIGFAGTIDRAAQQSLFQAFRDIEALPPDEQMRLGENMDDLIDHVGLGNATDLQRVLLATYPLACMVEPRCVPTAADITNARKQIALEWLTPDDRNAIFEACFIERGARVAAVAPFRDAAATA